jgi:hypothetical protein
MKKLKTEHLFLLLQRKASAYLFHEDLACDTSCIPIFFNQATQSPNWAQFIRDLEDLPEFIPTISILFKIGRLMGRLFFFLPWINLSNTLFNLLNYYDRQFLYLQLRNGSSDEVQSLMDYLHRGFETVTTIRSKHNILNDLIIHVNSLSCW